MLGKRILIGICGGIAAYKTLTLIRLFRKAGCEVKVIATRNALSFVTPLTIETLSNNKLYVDMFECGTERTTEHIALAQWADMAIVAPATANIIAKLANGIADDALSTTLLALSKPLFIAPAMNENMYEHIAVQRNLKLLEEYHYHIISPEKGMLACNVEGKGRMAEPKTIFDRVGKQLQQKILVGKKALVTAGPTCEPIDPVRFIGNRSSGLMGFSIAETLADKGCDVTLVTGATYLKTRSQSIHRIDVNTADEMLQACLPYADKADIIVMAAAVADYTPETKADHKLKKKDALFSLNLKPTTDILKTLAKNKTDNQIIIGFALETDNELTNAKQKLHTKNIDFIVLNSLKDKGAGFECATNKVTVIDKNDNVIEIPLKSKQEIAENIIQIVFNTPKS
ncbi:MAG: bifunctional phosphopantothenoylcysteine decarboxylase/phosphopantothenate--cysteine ligase CoaBC [Bacteroidales bacterium]|jgi:phosphopantothenoylcysteine decarboxylase/phosphopantothenate--cysteine ligase|nr:bifunctional phosphopantothenoylcysteine decarboxylase/phosphopantothenate--cysteine ligase CoaBC [Bacteroidales bacterium]